MALTKFTLLILVKIEGLVELNQVTDCAPGYDQTNTGECVDIDECYSSNPCKNGYCTNTDGSYE